MKERVARITNWLKDVYNYDKELKKFNRFFRENEKPNGALTRPGIDLDPTIRAVLTVRDFPIQKNYLAGDTLTEEQMQKLRHALLFSLRGNYEINSLSEREGVSVGISLEDNDAHTYLSTNTATTVAFLKYFNGYIDRYQEASSIKTNQEVEFPQIVLDFPKATPAQSRQSKLYIFIRLPSQDVDKRFTKMILPLINSN